MDDFDILDRMIHQKARVTLDENGQKPKVILAEADLYTVTILGMPDRDNTIIIKGYQPRFVSFRNIGLNKRPTREMKAPIHDRPDRMLKLNSGVAES